MHSLRGSCQDESVQGVKRLVIHKIYIKKRRRTYVKINYNSPPPPKKIGRGYILSEKYRFAYRVVSRVVPSVRQKSRSVALIFILYTGPVKHERNVDEHAAIMLYIHDVMWTEVIRTVVRVVRRLITNVTTNVTRNNRLIAVTTRHGRWAVHLCNTLAIMHFG